MLILNILDTFSKQGEAAWQNDPQSKRNAAPGEAPSDQAPGHAQARRLFCAAPSIGVCLFNLRQEGRAGVDQEIIELALKAPPKPMPALRQILAAQVDAQAKEEIDGGVIAGDGLRSRS